MKAKPKRGFKTSPSIRIPRAAMEKQMQAAAAAAAAELDIYLQALMDAVKMLDASSFGAGHTYRCLTPAELKRLEEIRLLAIGV